VAWWFDRPFVLSQLAIVIRSKQFATK